MNFEKFSERARGFVQTAQGIAMRENHQRFLPDHLLKALLDDEQGLAANLIKAAGGGRGRGADQRRGGRSRSSPRSRAGRTRSTWTRRPARS
jgi:ATP-dependent Clp protease ATP-binding subunit ClpB